MTNYLVLVIAALVVIAIAKFVLHLSIGKIIGLAINAIIGFVVLYVLNLTGLVSIPLNIVTALVAGIFGLPGVILLIILTVVGVL